MGKITAVPAPGVELNPEEIPLNPEYSGPEDAPPSLEQVKPDYPKDTRYIVLKEPIEVGGRERLTLNRLLIDPEELSGADYDRIDDKFRERNPKLHRVAMNPAQDKEFLDLVLCALNPPMIPEDARKIGFGDKYGVYFRLKAKIYSLLG